jgi:hypothetical protein
VINLTSWERVEFDFRGEKVYMEIRGLYNDEYALVAPFMEQAGAQKDVTQEQMAQNLKSLSELQPIFSSAVRNIEGITDEGEAFKPEMLARRMDVFSLAFDVILEIVNKSMLTVKEKNSSGGPSQSPNAELTG